VSVIALIELVRVLTSCYDLTREQIAEALDALLRARELVLDRAEQVGQALRVFVQVQQTSQTVSSSALLTPQAAIER